MPVLDAKDLAEIEAIVHRALALKAADVAPFPRLTVAQFAIAVELSREVVRRKIRTREIPRDYVFGSGPFVIAPGALALFGVTRQAARLALERRAPAEARNLWPESSPTSE